MNNKVFIIAELSANHGGKIEVAKETIRAAKKAGADAIKLQTYTADTITLDSDKPDFIIEGTIWEGRKLYDLYKEAHLPWDWHEELFQTAREEGLVCFSSPFDHSAVDFLEELNTPMYKIASFEITDIPLIRYAASKGKPMIISTGVASYEDIELAVDACREEGNEDITILKCTSAYPATLEDANLLTMQQIAKDFGVKVGLSDHTLGITAPVVATALGASVIEKHFILDKAIGGPDASFSLDVKGFAAMVEAVRNAEKSLGEATYNLKDSQVRNKQFARSLYVAQDMKAGDVVTIENVRSVRPGFGLHPKHLHDILGKEVLCDLVKGTPFSLDYLKTSNE
jgi:pseudaminic acid synthase